MSDQELTQEEIEAEWNRLYAIRDDGNRDFMLEQAIRELRAERARREKAEETLYEIKMQATRKERASGLKRYLETDLEIIAKKARAYFYG